MSIVVQAGMEWGWKQTNSCGDGCHGGDGCNFCPRAGLYAERDSADYAVERPPKNVASEVMRYVTPTLYMYSTSRSERYSCRQKRQIVTAN